MKYTITFSYEGKQYVYHDDYEYQGWDEWRDADAQVTHMYTEGNYGCDCNRSGFIAGYCDASFPKMECGDEIALVSIVDETGRVIWPESVVPQIIYVQQPSGLYVPTEVK